MLFVYPDTTFANLQIAKSRIYQHQTVKSEIKDLFTAQVEKIIWAYKLSSINLNIAESEELPEIQIFQIKLKQDVLDTRVLSSIDTAIPSPIIFELHTNSKIQAIAAFKPYGKTQKTLLSRYFNSPWYDKSESRQPLPYASNIEELYGKLLTPLLPYDTRPGENIKSQVERIEQIEKLESAIQRCKAKLHKEKQFNRQVPINQELRALQKELASLNICEKKHEQ